MERSERSRHIITDQSYFDAVKALVSELNYNEIPYAVVGGTAYQIKLASLLGGNDPITSISGLESVLRPTGDIDLAVQSDASEMTRIFNEMAMTSSFQIENRLHNSAALKVGSNSVSVNYETSPEELRVISSHYGRIIDTAESVYLSHSRRSTASINIPKPEYLLVTKLLMARVKDFTDISNLLNVMRSKGKKVDFEEILSILKSVNKENKFEPIKEIAWDFYRDS